jgi:hypothetical protein
MLILLLGLVLTAIQPTAKALPPIAEPNWETWQGAAPDAKRRASEAWATLCNHRPEREYKTEAEQQQAERIVDAAYKTLEAIPQATCAAGASLMRNSKDDWERIMIASTIKQLEKDKGEPFLVWALARATKVDATFEPVFYSAYELASKGRPEYLPAIFSILHAHDVQLNLPLHAWANEIGSKDALTALEAAMSKEKHEDVRNEMRAAIDHLRAEGKPLDKGRPKLSKAELQQALDEAERANGLQGDIDSITASAGRDNLKQLEQIRLRSTHVMSDLGNKWFRRWTQVIKSISRRAD